MTNSPQSALTLVKASLARRDFATARAALTPLMKENESGTPAFFMARIEFEEGNQDVAQAHIDLFRAKYPFHGGAKLLNARIALAKKDYVTAKTEALATLAMDPDLIPAQELIVQIEATINRETAEKHIDVIEDGYLDARQNGPTKAMTDAAVELSKMTPGPDWENNPVDAIIAYFKNAPDLESALRNYDGHLIDVSVEFGYIAWPKRIDEHVIGKSILDVGCGFGGYGMGFLVAGAKSYAGLDPVMKLDSTRAKNKRTRTWSDMGFTPRSIAAKLPAIRLFEGTSEDLDFDEKFDTVALHNVTEHLIQLDMVFEGLLPVCHPDTRIVFLHHNFYCWNGHHMDPNRPDQLDEDNPEHRLHFDWRHIDAVPGLPDDHYFHTHLNRVRLNEIRAITEKHFDVIVWEERPSSQETLARLTPQILDRVRKTVPDITEQELSTNVVYCVAKAKPATLARLESNDLLAKLGPQSDWGKQITEGSEIRSGVTSPLRDLWALGDWIEGWVWDRANPDAMFNVVVMMNGEPVFAAPAKTHIPALGVRTPGLEKHGFRFPVMAEFAESDAGLQLVIVETGDSVRNGTFVAAQASGMTGLRVAAPAAPAPAKRPAKPTPAKPKPKPAPRKPAPPPPSGFIPRLKRYLRKFRS